MQQNYCLIKIVIKFSKEEIVVPSSIHDEGPHSDVENFILQCEGTKAMQYIIYCILYTLYRTAMQYIIYCILYRLYRTLW